MKTEEMLAKKAVKGDFEALKNLWDMIAGNIPVVQVGILGSGARTDGEQTNAEIGVKHEFGDYTSKPRIPKRSFIRMPLQTHFEEKIQENATLTKKEFQKALKNGKLNLFAKRMGAVAEAVIQEGFATRGWGNWKPNALRTQALKGSDSPLIDTAEMRKSITSRVEKKSSKKAIDRIAVKL
jgi:phage gpG-like protein